MVVEWDSRSHPGPKNRASPRRPATGFVLLASTGRCEPGSVGWTLGRWDGRTGFPMEDFWFSDDVNS
jgi:hypothetical protein